MTLLIYWLLFGALGSLGMLWYFQTYPKNQIEEEIGSEPSMQIIFMLLGTLLGFITGIMLLPVLYMMWTGKDLDNE